MFDHLSSGFEGTVWSYRYPFSPFSSSQGTIHNDTSYQEFPNHMKDHPFQTMGFSWTFMDFSYDFDQPKWSKPGISRFSHQEKNQKPWWMPVGGGLG